MLEPKSVKALCVSCLSRQMVPFALPQPLSRRASTVSLSGRTLASSCHSLTWRRHFKLRNRLLYCIYQVRIVGFCFFFRRWSSISDIPVWRLNIWQHVAFHHYFMSKHILKLWQGLASIPASMTGLESHMGSWDVVAISSCNLWIWFYPAREPRSIGLVRSFDSKFALILKSESFGWQGQGKHCGLLAVGLSVGRLTAKSHSNTVQLWRLRAPLLQCRKFTSGSNLFSKSGSLMLPEVATCCQSMLIAFTTCISFQLHLPAFFYERKAPNSTSWPADAFPWQPTAEAKATLVLLVQMSQERANVSWTRQPRSWPRFASIESWKSPTGFLSCSFRRARLWNLPTLKRWSTSPVFLCANKFYTT